MSTKNYSQTNQGITIIEAIVSITLLMIAVTGLMTLSGSGIRSAGNSRNELVATQLATEGLEIVHSMRDNNSADDATPTHTNWLSNIFNRCDPFSGSSGCVLDVTGGNPANVWSNTSVITECNPCATLKMYVHPTTGLYRQNGTVLGAPWKETPFTRIVTMTGIDNNTTPVKQIRVTSTVTYPGYRGTIQAVSVSEDLLNWFPKL